MSTEKIKEDFLRESLNLLVEHAYFVGRLDAINNKEKFDVNKFKNNIDLIILMSCKKDVVDTN
jgi:hypothetical protein